MSKIKFTSTNENLQNVKMHANANKIIVARRL